MARKKARRENGGLPADMEDEVDVFHKGKEKISLNKDEEDASDEDLSEDEVDVYNLGSEEEEEDEEEDGEESDGESEGRLADLKRQERLMRAKIQLQQGEGSDSGESEEEEEQEARGWGARKGAYYEQGEAEDEEALREEEEEALAIQRKAAEELGDQDLGAESSSGEETEGDFEADQQIGSIHASGAAGKAIIEQDAPELEALLSQLLSSLQEVRSRIGPLVKEVREGNLATAEGVTYLETKNLLLLQYCMHLMFYLLLKAEGQSVQQHPVIARLVEIRAFLEKIRPIDKKLRYQIDKLLTSHQAVQAAALANDEAELDPLQFRPNPSALVSRLEAPKAGGEAVAGVYRPPKLNPVAMEDDPDRDNNKRKRRAAANQARKSSRNELMRDLAREVEDAPEELRETRAGEETEQAARQRARLDRRAAEEEELMMRVPLAKKDLKGMRAAQRAGLSGGALLDDFADDVADLVKASDNLDTGGRLSQKFGADLSQAGDRNKVSGDADLPSKMPLADRRAKLDNARVKQKKQAEPLSGAADLIDFNGLDDGDGDNQMYEEAKESKKRKKAAKAAMYDAAPTQPPQEEILVAGPRKVTREVDQNRGLTPHRRKDMKNPRVKGRKKFEKATIRRKSQVSDVKRPSGAYGGEKTGIKARVTKSTRL